MARRLLALATRALSLATAAGMALAAALAATSPEAAQGLWHLVLARSARIVTGTAAAGVGVAVLGGSAAIGGHRLARAFPRAARRLCPWAAAVLAAAGYAAGRALLRAADAAPGPGAGPGAPGVPPGAGVVPGAGLAAGAAGWDVAAGLLGAAAAWLLGRHLWASTREGVEPRADLRGAGVALVAASLLGAAALATDGRFAAKRPNLLLLVVDCLRPDHLGAYGHARDTSPTIDGMAERGLLFGRAYGTSSWTKPAVASLLSGLEPGHHGVLDPFDVYPAALPALPRTLRNAGYETFFLNGGNVFLGEQFGFARLFDGHVAREATAAGLHADLAAALSARRDPRRPFFAYLHYMDAHLPYHENPENARFRAAGPSPSSLRPGEIRVGMLRARIDAGTLDPADRQRVRDLYDGQIRYVDQELGALVAWLRASRLLRDTVIVLTADHGEELFEHGNVEHGHTLHEELVRVPLILFGPGIEPGRVDAPVSLVDVAPTLLRLAGVARPPGGDGLDLLAAAPAAEGRTLRLQGTLYGPERHALVRGPHKAIARAANDTARRHLVGPRSFAPRELYDLASDPGEQHPLADAAGPELARLRDALDAYAAESPAAAAPEVDVDEDTRMRLRALGYAP